MPPQRPDPIAYLTGRLSDAAVPSGVLSKGPGAKFTPNGKVLPWRGNTIICHVDRESAAHEALCDMQAALRGSDLAPYFTYLPSASFHMTVFQGISNGTDWPDNLPQDATLDLATDIMAHRLSGVTGPREFEVTAHDLYCGFGVTISGANAAEEEKLRQTRRILRDATGIASHDFDAYGFHITLSYLLRWLSPNEAQEVVDLSQTIFARHCAALRQISLGPLEFCRFENMHHFAPVKFL